MKSVGALFAPGSSGHTCTASVVDSAAGDLLVTAAHCIWGTGVGFTFVPEYRNGTEPFGSWKVVGAYGDGGWISAQDPEQDVAFLVVAKKVVRGRSEEIQSVVGGNRLGAAPASGSLVTVPAYAAGSHDRPFTCSARVYYDASYPAFNCSAYGMVTSGAPWLARSGRGWSVVGVIGGLNQGGCSVRTSYTAPFDTSTRLASLQASSGAGGEVFPLPGSDGCPS
jgi:V8-like Glu-specific endopeptidase